MRYFFNVRNGSYVVDDLGSELPDLDAMREEALDASIQLLRGVAGDALWGGEAWSMHVTDEAGRGVLTLRFSAEEPREDQGMAAS